MTDAPTKRWLVENANKLVLMLEVMICQPFSQLLCEGQLQSKRMKLNLSTVHGVTANDLHNPGSTEEYDTLWYDWLSDFRASASA